MHCCWVWAIYPQQRCLALSRAFSQPKASLSGPVKHGELHSSQEALHIPQQPWQSHVLHGQGWGAAHGRQGGISDSYKSKEKSKSRTSLRDWGRSLLLLPSTAIPIPWAPQFSCPQPEVPVPCGPACQRDRSGACHGSRDALDDRGDHGQGKKGQTRWHKLPWACRHFLGSVRPSKCSCADVACGVGHYPWQHESQDAGVSSTQQQQEHLTYPHSSQLMCTSPRESCTFTGKADQPLPPKCSLFPSTTRVI